MTGAMHPYDRRRDTRPDTDLITIDELCDWLRVSRRTIDRRRKSGRLSIPEYDILGRPMYRRKQVEEWLSGRLVGRWSGI